MGKSHREAMPCSTPAGETGMKRQTVKPRPPALLKYYRTGFYLVGHLCPPLAGRYAYKLWFTPVRHKTPASEQSAMASAVVSQVVLGQHRVQTYEWGENGPAVLLVHGWSGRGTQLGAFVQPLIDAGYRVKSFDLPAHGGSSGKQTHILAVATLIPQLVEYFGGVDSIITHSFGGACLALAIRQGLMVRRVVAISPPATTEYLLEKFAETLNLTSKTVDYMIRRLENGFGRQIWGQISVLENVRKLNTPALIIHDNDDLDVACEQGKQVADAWPGARFVKTTGLGHRRILRDATTIAHTVSFLQEDREIHCP